MKVQSKKHSIQKSKAAVAAAIFATFAIASPALAQRDKTQSAVGSEPVAAPSQPTARPGGGRFDQPAPVSNGQPMYVVRARQFHAFNESGFDWAGSDEVYGVWSSGSSLAGTKVFGNVDSGDTRSFKQGQDCIYPMNTTGYLDGRSGDTWGCIGEGGPAPIDFHISLWEADGTQIFPICFQSGTGPEPDCEDDILGSHGVSLSQSELTIALPNEGDTLVVYELMNNCLAETGCVTNRLSPKYFIRYEILRVADKDLTQVVKG